MTAAVAAVDLGATSGRVMLGFVSHNELSLRPVARFPNTPVATIDGLHWNILELYRNVVAGLGAAVREEPSLQSIAVDSWAVDYALMRGNRMLGNPYHYRDERGDAGVEKVSAVVSAAELYDANGLQFLPFNTLYQFAADAVAGSLDQAETALLIPDLINFWLTGVARAEKTNASTTGLLNVHTREWDDALIARLGLPRALFPELVEAGTPIGTLLPAVASDIGLSSQAARSLQVTAVGSHDTASAVVAVPATGDDFAYISSGTWSLVGVELPSAVVSEASRLANFTNEGGVDGRVRYLSNVMGLWLLSESVRTWEKAGGCAIDLPDLLSEAAAVTTPVAVFDADDARFLAPGDVPSRIVDWCASNGVDAPRTRAEFVRSIIESLAHAYAAKIEQLAELSGRSIRTIHIVGGGSLNALLCQLTADRTGRTVLAGPIEATAIGNVLIQARAQGLVTGSLESLRSLVAQAFAPVVYEPRSR
ncbi:rhamnulokinase [Agreia bicolorata]|uniref:Rhamnulokinase n=1 Tax=Agreia bicolorata TaxID=110935 RepID=A0A1T4WRJ6_9MICO|nr:rhamnulokinase family protein [Agreia bicolorata]SKA79974.1 rhamnulokinase [Agreia bicolorata]